MTVNWKQTVVDELDEQYDIAANVVKNTVEVEMPSTRHVIEISLSNLYGFVISLTISDETGGVIYDNSIASCVRLENIASDVAGMYNSY